jgi:hypothetical protein
MTRRVNSEKQASVQRHPFPKYLQVSVAGNPRARLRYQLPKISPATEGKTITQLHTFPPPFRGSTLTLITHLATILATFRIPLEISQFFRWPQNSRRISKGVVIHQRRFYGVIKCVLDC